MSDAPLVVISSIALFLIVLSQSHRPNLLNNTNTQRRENMKMFITITRTKQEIGYNELVKWKNFKCMNFNPMGVWSILGKTIACFNIMQSMEKSNSTNACMIITQDGMI